MKYYGREKLIKLAFILGIIILICTRIFNYFQSEKLMKATKWVFHTHEVIEKVEEIYDEVNDSENGMRSYLLTTDLKSLESFMNSEKLLKTKFNELESLVSDNEIQINRVKDLKEQVNRKLDWIKNIINDKKKRELISSTEKQISLEGIESIAKIRAIVNDLIKEESKLLEIRHEKMIHQNRFNQILITTIIFFVAFFLGYVFWVINKEMVKRKMTELEIQKLNEELLTEIDYQNHLLSTDYLTGAKNRMYFTNRLLEQLSLQKHDKGYCFTVAYIDCDNFKNINDTLGHKAGDDLLITLTKTAKEFLSEDSIFARLGGDEFSVILQKANGEEGREILLELNNRLLQAMIKNHWQVTFSIGAISFISYAESIDSIIKSVDDLMYEVKKKTKNNLVHKVL
ncbi:MAG: diguanylate cyclase [Leptospiraceae bacterium]|nr:diguanylate cyclase [Leptospiraceae bacterium]